MCTVSVICSQDSQDAGLWLVSSRDELHGRMPSLEPRVHRLGERQALFPLDPEGGGTWVGVNDLGTAVSLLNHYPAYVPEPAHKQSRGDLVVRLLAATDARKALAALAGEDLSGYGSCKLVMVSAAGVLTTLTWDGQEVVVLQHDVPQVWASSSTHHRAANDHRRSLFFQQQPQTFETLQVFHRDQSHSNSALNVFMHSPEARTVSVTAVHVAAAGIAMHYLPVIATQAERAKRQLEHLTFQQYQLPAAI